MSIKLRFTLPALALALFAAHAATAQAPAGAPAGANGVCNDGTYSTAAAKSGACGGHKGVKTWFAAATPATKSAPPSTTPAPKPTAATPAPAAKTTAAASPAPTGAAPAGATFVCKDGSYSMNATKSGACSGHKGVAGPVGAAAATPAAKPMATPAPATAAKPAAAPAPAAPAAAKPMPAPAAAAAPGGGPGTVWVNTATKVYHCPTDRYYGKTKAGKYVTESAAVAEGDKPDAGKACK